MWKDLSMKDKASYIRMGVENGITDLDTIREVYNKFAIGGPVKKSNYYYADSDTTDPNFTDLTPIGEGVYKNKFGKVVYDTTKVTPPEKDKSINDNLQTAYAKGIPSGTMASDMETMNAVTGGVLNWTMPSQVVGATARLINDGDFGQFGRNLILGNSGIVTDNFAQEHPYWSLAANVLFDGVAFGTPKTIKTTYNLRPSNLRQHIFANISPIGYDNVKQRVIKAVKSAASGEAVDIDNPEWFNAENAKILEAFDLVKDSKDFGERALKARFDAWRKYLGLPQKYDTWTPSENLLNHYTDVENVNRLQRLPDYNQVDFVNSAGGNTSTKMRVIDGSALGNQYGVTQITDLWDLQPFQRRIIDFENSKIAPLYNKIIGKPFRAVGKYIIEKGQDLKYDNKAINDYLKNTSEWDREMFDPDMFITENKWKSKIGDNIVKLGKNIEEKGYYHKSPLLSKIGNIEMSQLIPGAKPFNIEYTIPWTEKCNIEKRITEFFRGFDSNDILPPKVSEFKQMNPNLNYDYKGPSQFANGGPITKTYRDRAGRFDDVDYSYLDNYLGNKKSLGGILYKDGGYKPSSSIKKRISNWEGSSMKTNRSFEAEARDFNASLPKGATSKLSQTQLDGLYSYSYNVGAGNFRKRVNPVLTRYLAGQATIQDVQRAMWASKDNQLRGLANRRNIERSMLGNFNPEIETPSVLFPVSQLIINTPYISTNNVPIDNKPIEIPELKFSEAIEDTPPVTADTTSEINDTEETYNTENSILGLLDTIKAIRNPRTINIHI